MGESRLFDYEKTTVEANWLFCEGAGRVNSFHLSLARPFKSSRSVGLLAFIRTEEIPNIVAPAPSAWKFIDVFYHHYVMAEWTRFFCFRLRTTIRATFLIVQTNNWWEFYLPKNQLSMSLGENPISRPKNSNHIHNKPLRWSAPIGCPGLKVRCWWAIGASGLGIMLPVAGGAAIARALWGLTVLVMWHTKLRWRLWKTRAVAFGFDALMALLYRGSARFPTHMFRRST